MAISTKLERILFKLSNLYFPFNNLTAERLQEIVNHIRIIELNQGEILHIRGGNSQDYLYLLEGKIDVLSEGCIESINDPAETQRTPVLLPANSTNYRILSRENCIICHANRDILDTIIAWDHVGRELRHSIQHIDIIRNTLVFNHLPIEYIKSAFACMRTCKVQKGDTIQTEESDAYYLILSGQAEVQRFNNERQANTRITTLSVGDTFGKAALVAGKELSETIVMLEHSELLVLDLQDYNELICRPVVKTVQAQIAQTMLGNNYQLIDVRFPEEYAQGRIPGARLIPLGELSKRLNELNKEQPYILYCHSGPRSAMAALILNEKKFEALSLQGGIRDWPFDIEYSISRSNIVPLTKKFH
jgi:rhodanese-related sulfurtransferase